MPDDGATETEYNHTHKIFFVLCAVELHLYPYLQTRFHLALFSCTLPFKLKCQSKFIRAFSPEKCAQFASSP